jgi:hypothetical protein
MEWTHGVVWVMSVFGFLFGYVVTQDPSTAFAFGIGALLVVYVQMIPTFIAISREHKQVAVLAILDLLLGWTGIVWAGLLAWALWDFGGDIAVFVLMSIFFGATGFIISLILAPVISLGVFYYDPKVKFLDDL